MVKQTAAEKRARVVCRVVSVAEALCRLFTSAVATAVNSLYPPPLNGSSVQLEKVRSQTVGGE